MPQAGLELSPSHSPTLGVVKSLLDDKRIFAFDLDDILHEFRKASGQAAMAVFEYFASKDDVVNVLVLREAYRVVLSQKTANAFVEGKTSTEHRKQRFVALMERVGIQHTPETLAELTSIYKDSLRRSLELKPGVIQLFIRGKSPGKTIVVVTDGPHDAQKKSIEQLGLFVMVDQVF